MKLLVTILLSLILSLTFFSKSKAQQSYITGYDIIHRMHNEYEEKWYKNLTFTQKTTFYGRNGQVERVQTWYEALSIPGKLAIKFDEPSSNNGILFNDGIQYSYANGELIQEAKRNHDLLILGFDVYHQDPDKTANQLIENGYDIKKVYEDTWQGRPVFVIGVNSPDSTKPQFWIDIEGLYFVRNLTIGRQNTIQEVQFNKYEQLGGGWIAPEVIFKANGFTGLLEEYSQIVIPDTIDTEIFNPVMFTETSWE